MADPALVYSKSFGDASSLTTRNYLIPDDAPAAPWASFALADNDVVILAGQFAATTTTTSKTAGPATITKKNGNSDIFSGVSASMFLYAGKVARTDKNTNITIVTSTARFVTAVLMIWRNVDPDADLDAVGFQKAFGTSGTALTTPTTTVVRANSIEVQVVGQSHATAYAAPTASFTKPAAVTTLIEQNGTAGTAGQSIIAAGSISTVRAAGASIGGTVWTAPVSDAWEAVTIVLPPNPTGINHAAVIETTLVAATGGTISAVLTDASDSTWDSIDSTGLLGLEYLAQKPSTGSPVVWKGRAQRKTGTTTATISGTMYAHGDRTTVLATAPAVTITAIQGTGWQDFSLVFPASSTDAITSGQFAALDIVITDTAS